MNREGKILAHEIALKVLEEAAETGTLSESHQSRVLRLVDKNVRPGVASTLETESVQSVGGPLIEVAESAEKRELARVLNLEEGYEEAFEVQKAFGLMRHGVMIPHFDHVVHSFTAQMLAEATYFQNPRLVLSTKGRSFDDLVAAMDAHKAIEGQRDTFVFPNYRRHGWRPAENWGAYIVEAAPKMDFHEFDNKTKPALMRLQTFKCHKNVHGLQGIDRWKYTQLAMLMLKDGEYPDGPRCYTFLDEDPVTNHKPEPPLECPHIAVARWRPEDRHISFNDCLADRRQGVMHFRLSVGGLLPD